MRDVKRAERAQYRERQQNERKRLMADLESTNVDGILLNDLAMKSAKSAIASRSISSLNMNITDENNQSSAVLAGLLSTYEMAKPAVKK